MKYLLLIVLLAGCYNQRKAQQQFSRAVTFDQKIGSDYCAAQFPSTSTTVHDTTTTTDSIYIEGAERLDTVMSHDTLRITRTKTDTLWRNKTNTIRDTIIKEGGKTLAELKSCQIDNSRLIAQADKTNAKLTRVQKTKSTLWWLVIVLGISTGGLLASKIKGLFKSPLKLPV